MKKWSAFPTTSLSLSYSGIKFKVGLHSNLLSKSMENNSMMMEMYDNFEAFSEDHYNEPTFKENGELGVVR